MNKLILLLATLSVCACGPTEKSAQGYEDYSWEGKESYLQKSEVVKVDTVIDYILQIQPYGDRFLVEYPYDWAVFHRQGEALSFERYLIRKGEGPEESLSSMRYARMDDGRCFFGECIGSRKVFIAPSAGEGAYAPLVSWKKQRFTGAEKYYFESLQPVDDEVVLGGVQGDCPSKFVVSNLHTGVSSPLEGAPYPPLYAELSDFEKSFAAEGFLLKRPGSQRYFYGATVGLYAFVFDCDGQSIRNVRMLYNRPAPFVSRGEQGSRPRLTDGTSAYNAPPFVTDRCIYLSARHVSVKDAFSDHPSEGLPYIFTKEIVAFRWDGTPFRKYILDEPVRGFFVDEEKSLLYGFGANDQNGDVILVYDLQ